MLYLELFTNVHIERKVMEERVKQGLLNAIEFHHTYTDWDFNKLLKICVDR